MRIFLHYRNDDFYDRDPKGQDFPDLRAAEAEARKSAAELLVADAALFAGGIYELVDEDGRLLSIIRFPR
jgi:hypothetical protein